MEKLLELLDRHTARHLFRSSHLNLFGEVLVRVPVVAPYNHVNTGFTPVHPVLTGSLPSNVACSVLLLFKVEPKTCRLTE